MDQERFDQLAVAVARGATRRTLLHLARGSLAVLLAGLARGAETTDAAKRRTRHGQGRPERQRAGAAAKSCAQQCRKKKSKAARRKCRTRCTPPTPECTTSQDCPAGELCESGVCIPIPDQCQTDADCDECEQCEGGVCRATCLPPQRCQNGQCIGGGGGGCRPTTCAAAGAACGRIPTGCGGTRDCGDCPPPQSCGGGDPGTPNVCGCTALQCPAGANCGTILNPCDGTAVSCGGPCPAGQVCGAGVSPNVCGGTCTPRTCAAGNCGPLADGCGGLVQCGPCSPGQVCGGGAPSVCGGGTCTPRTCAQQGIQCGPAGDGCGGMLNCGTCTAPQTCGGGGIPNVCGGGRASITLTKSSDAAGAISEGEVITYTFRVANTGPSALEAVVVSDPLPGLSGLTCGSSSLAPGAVLVCTAGYVVTAADVAAGQITNIATVSGITPGNVVVTATASLVIP